MVETKEFVVIFRNEKTENDLIKFIPTKVVEGKYNDEFFWFVDKDGLMLILKM